MKQDKKQSGEFHDIPASPTVRRIARESGIDLLQVKGTGPGNRITIDDIKQAAVKMEKGQMPVSSGISEPDRFGNVERKPISRVRKLTAENTVHSWNKIPHVTQFEKADITLIEQFRNDHLKVVEKAGGKLTITSIIVKIAALALEKFPVFNTFFDEGKEEIVYKRYINIGIAVDTERGLLVPVIRNVENKSVTQIAVEIGELAEKARNKKISADEMQGGNFTISNLGGIGGSYFTPVIYTGQTAILGISKSQIEPVWDGKAFSTHTYASLVVVI
ncbi:MAG: hypothetical protein HC906_13305 [Bacteroidales bacterium]|nr:hypothetical protein [Bacteroidales bacterium]